MEKANIKQYIWTGIFFFTTWFIGTMLNEVRSAGLVIIGSGLYAFVYIVLGRKQDDTNNRT